MLPPLHYNPMAPSPGYGGFPGGPPMSGMSPAPPPQGVVRSADEMTNGEDTVPPAKRQRVQKLPNGHLYPEQDWINMHPVSIFL
jgi:splicing factor 3A subunit 1